jgi:hypothetical protein
MRHDGTALSSVDHCNLFDSWSFTQRQKWLLLGWWLGGFSKRHSVWVCVRKLALGRYSRHVQSVSCPPLLYLLFIAIRNPIPHIRLLTKTVLATWLDVWLTACLYWLIVWIITEWKVKYVAVLNGHMTAFWSTGWLTRCLISYTVSRKVENSIPDEVIEFFNLPNPSSRTMALGSTQPPTEMSTTNLPRDKAAGM